MLKCKRGICESRGEVKKVGMGVGMHVGLVKDKVID